MDWKAPGERLRQGERFMNLRIRPMERTDISTLHALLSDEAVMRYIEPPFTLEQTKIFLEEAGLGAEPLIYAVTDESEDFLGYVIYHAYEEGSREIGWVLRKDAWGKGYARALTQQLIDRAKSEGKAVVIECAREQSVTKHIAESFGFSYIGRRDGCDAYELKTGKGS